MNQTEITAAIRRGIREPSTRTTTDEEITAVTLRGVGVLGLRLIQTNPNKFTSRTSRSSNTYIYTLPSDCFRIEKVYDMGGNAVSITGAADNGSGAIRITAASHGVSDEEIVLVHSVAGCTEANDTWQTTYVTANTLDLDGSTFTNTYTSGGKIFVDPSDPDEIKQITMQEATLSHMDNYYMRNGNIVVDDDGFDADIILDYLALPSAITDIEAVFHEWLVSFGIVELMDIPSPDARDYQDKVNQTNKHQGRMGKIEQFINQTYKGSSEPQYIRDVMNID